MQQQLAEFDARIAALEASLGVTPSQNEQPQGNSDATASTAAVASPDGMVYAKTSDPGPYEPGAQGGMGYKQSPYAKEAKSGPFPYEFGKGFVLARGPNGEVDFSTKGYVRYLNQMDLDPFYTDAFGRTTKLDLRQDIQLNRLQTILTGWRFDERFRYFFMPGRKM